MVWKIESAWANRSTQTYPGDFPAVLEGQLLGDVGGDVSANANRAFGAAFGDLLLEPAILLHLQRGYPLGEAF